MDGDPGSATGSPTNANERRTALARDYSERRFQREFRLQLLGKAAEREAKGSVAAPAEKKRLWAPPPPRKKSPKRDQKKSSKRKPKALFDAEATLNILPAASGPSETAAVLVYIH